MYLQKINLKNKYALVTGAGKGLGRACSLALAEAGATVIVLSRTMSDLNKLEKDFKKIKGKLIIVSYLNQSLVNPHVECSPLNCSGRKKRTFRCRLMPAVLQSAWIGV